MDTPSAVQAFFAAEDLERVVSAFTPDAVVKDEGNTYRGRQAIRVKQLGADQAAWPCGRLSLMIDSISASASCNCFE